MQDFELSFISVIMFGNRYSIFVEKILKAFIDSVYVAASERSFHALIEEGKKEL